MRVFRLWQLPFSFMFFFVVTTSFNGRPSINFALIIARYIRPFMRSDPKEAIQYVYCICLNAEQPGAGQEQVEVAWDLSRKVIVGAEKSGSWEELVGGFRPDGLKFVSVQYLRI